MVIDKETQDAVKEKLERQQPLMDVDRLKEDFLTWLSELKVPTSSDASSWADSLKTFPTKDQERSLVYGRRIRLALQLHTVENQYVISIIENFEPSSRGIYTLCVYVNWKLDEWEKQKMLESDYKGKFDDLPQARHIIWGQTFRPSELNSGLNACAKAILGNELTPHCTKKTIGERLHRPPATSVNFPSPTEE